MVSITAASSAAGKGPGSTLTRVAEDSLDNYWKSSKDYYDDDEHCRGRNYFWDAPDLQCDY